MLAVIAKPPAIAANTLKNKMPKLIKEKEASPILQKLALTLFALGPIILIFFFLSSNGFFTDQ